MSRRHEDFDEFCDPENPRPIKYDEVKDALERLSPFITKTPCMPSHHQREFTMKLYYKIESMQITGSFKERGSLNVLQLLPLDKKKIGVVIASIGNDAIGICHYGAKLGIPVVVVVPVTIPICKLQNCYSLGAKVILEGSNLTESQRFARSLAKDKGLTYINARDHPHILMGYGTLALEILEQIPLVEAVIVPVGSGGLIAAVAAVIKHIKPNCLVYGVQSENIPAFFKSLEMDKPIQVPMQDNMADAISVPNVGVNAFHTAKTLVDKMLLVNQDWIARSILHLIEKERFVIEGAGACPLAAILGNLVPELKTKYVVAILSGGNIDYTSLIRSLQRGLSVIGRLVRFSVGVKDDPKAYSQLLSLIANGGYNVVHQFQDRIWVEGSDYTIEIKLVCETRNLEHALELKRIIERAYPYTSEFETEPFNDKRMCPCYGRVAT
ncbi:uncharacterized protein LOC114245774 [Bombyx mandarina]|uniref:L-serine deaminase n=1 Tax=Bombyx mandarina TaxID=7092 RepID=A0A6J2JWQ4_BOMMA|nr:uncharacterized protein LOC114245774 [Bombyx mandarina]